MAKTILFLEHNVDGTVGGSHICLLGICRHIDRTAWLPVVCFYQDNQLVPSFRDLGVNVKIVDPFSPWVIKMTDIGGPRRILAVVQSAVNFLRMVLVRPWYWVRILRSQRVAIVHLNNSCGGDVDLVLGARVLGIPVVAHQRGFPTHFGLFEWMLARRMDRIIAVSDVVREHLVDKKLPAENVVRVHDGIDLNRLEQQRLASQLKTEFRLRNGKLVVGMLGNVKYWKGQRVLVEAMPSILKRFPNTHFFFVGKVADDHYKNELDGRLLALGIENRVTFTGYRPDATDLIGIMDVVVHASVEAEPFGLVVLEAMGKAKPIVATDLGGPKETVIQGVTGLLFESGNPRSLADAVCVFLADPSFRRKAGGAGADLVRGRFSAERNVRNIEAVYSEILKAGR